MRGLYSIAFLCILSCGIAAYADSLSLYTEGGVYNHTYENRQYPDEDASFPVALFSMNLEYLNEGDGAGVWGYGIALFQIDDGTEWNFDRLESQPHIVGFLPYVFAGYSFPWWGLDLGAGGLFYYRQFENSYYYNADGSTDVEKSSGMYLDRKRSHGFPNMSLRLLPEKSFHLKLNLARGDFNAVDSLFQLRFVFPMERDTLVVAGSLRTFIDRIPLNNQKFMVAWYRHGQHVTFGATLGYLVFNEHGGGRGDIGIFDWRNLSGGLHTSLHW